MAMGKVHVCSAYSLLAVIAMHIAGVVLSEVRQRGGLISAMFSGEKVFSDD